MAHETYTEKVSVNINTATLSQIDLLVDNGYYSNRSDFINQAVREALDKQRTTIDRIAERNTAKTDEDSDWFLGVVDLDAKCLTMLQKAGRRIRLRGYGLLIFDKDCTDELIFDTVESISVRGVVRCSDAVKKHYGIK